MAELATLARPYAKAVFALALDDQQKDPESLARWSETLGFLALLTSETSARQLLDSPTLSNDEKADAIIRLGRDILSAPGAQLVQVLAANKRLGLLQDIHRQYEIMRATQERSLDVEVISAFELDDQETTRLKETLKKRFARDIHMSNSTDESLIGGAIIRAGDTVIDGSVRGRLGKLAEALQRT